MASKKSAIAVETEYAAILAHRISTAEVKTATPSRAQGKIQVRVAWTDPNGARGLGYLAMSTGDAEQLARGASSGPSLKNFFQDVFRIVRWTKEVCRKETHSESNWGAYEEDLRLEVKKLGVFNSNSRIHSLHQECLKAIRDCAASGQHKNARKSRLQKRVKDAISGNIQFAISQGLTDEEIRDIVELAFVKHTMEC